MALTREDLESGRIERMFSSPGVGARCLTEAEHAASIEALLDGYCRGCDIWVFGYGSLVWNPLFRYAERRQATLHGYHRRFCLWSKMGRGTPDHPGLVLGLDRGGRCRGVAYRIARHHAAEELRLLWRREMVLGSYAPRWVTLRDTRRRDITAIAFIVNRAHPNYAGRLPIETVARVMGTAGGAIGPCSDYLRHTVEALAGEGIHDAHLAALHARVFGTRPPVSEPV